jgi:hypothetical protein
MKGRSGCESDKYDYELWTGWRAFAIVWVLCTLEYVSVLCEFVSIRVCVNTQWKGDRTQEGMNSTTQIVKRTKHIHAQTPFMLKGITIVVVFVVATKCVQ